MWTFIGIAAATLTMFSFVPQIIRGARTRSVKDISPVTLTQLSSGVALWIVYGIYRRDPVIIVANIVTLTTLMILAGMYVSYGKDTR